METYFGEFWIGRILLQRGLGAVYLIAFIVALNQFPALLGENGLQPVPRFLNHVSFSQSPSIFHFFFSDRWFVVVAWIGIFLSLTTVLGFSEKGPVWVSTAIWLTMWALYLSIVNVGQTFYSFGWESMLLEAGFFAAFLGPAGVKPSLIPILILRWMLFRTELGAGLIKMRAGGCWHDLTCLFYHHETQPMPNPLSWYFHQLPQVIHKLGVLFSHFVQLVIPFLLFGPKKIAAIAGILIIGHQLMLVVSGNYSWLNWVTIILAFTVFSDSMLPFLKSFIGEGGIGTGGVFYQGTLYALVVAVIVLSIQPVRNLLSSRQLMNYSYNPLHLVNTYGAFGSVTKKRYEIVVEGTNTDGITSDTEWKAYEFKAKPTDLNRRPPQFAPYHLRLDWLMWFLPFRVQVSEQGIIKHGDEEWFINFIRKLLEGDKRTLKLLKYNPFPDQPPRYIRARYYLYQFATPEERKKTKAWWKRILIDEYLKPVSLGR